MKVFNTTAVCIPEKHYMVDLSERVKEIKQLVDDGKYFTINRARQYGKTTIDALCKALSGAIEEGVPPEEGTPFLLGDRIRLTLILGRERFEIQGEGLMLLTGIEFL